MPVPVVPPIGVPLVPPMPPVPGVPLVPPAPPVPPLPPGGITVPGGGALQLGSGSGLPTQTSHFSQGLMHEVWGVQRGHAIGSPNFAAVQVGSRRTLTTFPPTGTEQQPKQSHPFGVIRPQLFAQVADWVVGQLRKFSW
jgi:hypothetical protein